MMAQEAPERPPVELSFWRTIARYLVSIVASLALGGVWWLAGMKLVHLGPRATIYSGVVALALGFVLMGFLWLSLDLGLPPPPGVDEKERSYQLFFLWLGIPLVVIFVIAMVAILALVLGPAVFSSGLPTHR